MHLHSIQSSRDVKKYYMVVMLVETTSVEQLVDRLRKGKYRSSSDVVAKSAYSDLPCIFHICR